MRGLFIKTGRALAWSWADANNVIGNHFLLASFSDSWLTHIHRLIVAARLEIETVMNRQDHFEYALEYVRRAIAADLAGEFERANQLRAKADFHFSRAAS